MILTPGEEQQPTVAGVDDAGKKIREDISDEPPSYEEAGARAATSTSRGSASQERPGASPTPQTPISEQDISRAPRVNFLQINTPYRNIAGNWNIDLSLPSLLTTNFQLVTTSTFMSHQGLKPNLYLCTEAKSIDAKIRVMNSGSEATPGGLNRALIVATNTFSNISVDLKARQAGTKVQICASSLNGNITIRLPKDFRGIVQCRAPTLTHNATAVRFTPRVKETMSVLSVEKTEIIVFVGDMTAVEQELVPSLPKADQSPSAGNENSLPPVPSNDGQNPAGGSTSSQQPLALDSWTGDQVEAVSTQGRIKICYTLLEGEEEEKEGEIETLYRHLQESGPIVALAKFAVRGVTKVISKKPKDKDKESGNVTGQ